jgi:hypothetical protein
MQHLTVAPIDAVCRVFLCRDAARSPVASKVPLNALFLSG